MICCSVAYEGLSHSLYRPSRAQIKPMDPMAHIWDAWVELRASPMKYEPPQPPSVSGLIDW